MADSKPSAKQLIRTSWEKAIAGRPDFDLTDEAKRLTAIMLQNDRFVRLFAEEFLYEEVLASGVRIVDRKPVSQQAKLHAVGSRRMTREALIKEVKDEIRSGSAAWMEYDYKVGRHIPLLEMTKPQLLAAADLRRVRVTRELERSEFLRMVANGMRDDQTVADAWTEDELNQLHESIEIKISTSLKRTIESSAVA